MGEGQERESFRQSVGKSNIPEIPQIARRLFLLLSVFAFGFGAIASKRSEDGGEKARMRTSRVGRTWTLRQTKLHRFGRNAGFIRQGVQSRGLAAA